MSKHDNDMQLVAEDVDGMIQRLVAALDDPRVTHMELVPELPPISARSPLDVTDSNADDDVENGTSDSTVVTCYHPFLVGDGCLGIPYPVMPTILKRATEDMQKIVGGSTSSSNEPASLNCAQHLSALTLCILSMNSDHHTAWNWRKRLMNDGVVSLENELRILTIFSTYRRHCKTSLLWHHRRWVINKMFAEADLQKIWRQEAVICERSCEKYPRNYHCWVYRWWFFHKMLVSAKSGHNDTDTHVFTNETEYAMSWIERHPADYAACHYLHKLADSTKDLAPPHSHSRQEIATKCLGVATANIMSHYAAYESIWNHRRWCITALMQDQEDSDVLASEVGFVEQVIHKFGQDDAVTALATRHHKWLSCEF